MNELHHLLAIHQKRVCLSIKLIIDILVQKKRDSQAAKRFLQKLRKQGGQPRLIVTDKLKSYIKPCAQFFPSTIHTRNKGENNRAENFTSSHPFERTQNEEIQIDQTDSAVSFKLCLNLRFLQIRSPLGISKNLQNFSVSPFEDLA